MPHPSAAAAVNLPTLAACPTRVTRLLLLVLLCLIGAPSAVRGGKKPRRLSSPDGRLMAVVAPVDRQKGYEEYESRILITKKSGVELRAQDFSSEDGEHGYGADTVFWTP